MVRFYPYIIISLLLGINSYARTTTHGGNVWEVAKAQQEILNQCMLKAPFQPDIKTSDLKVDPQDLPYLYILGYNLTNTVASIDIEEYHRDFLCQEWMPYLGFIHFYDAKGDESLIRNLHNRFKKTRKPLLIKSIQACLEMNQEDADKCLEQFAGEVKSLYL